MARDNSSLDLHRRLGLECGIVGFVVKRRNARDEWLRRRIQAARFDERNCWGDPGGGVDCYSLLLPLLPNIGFKISGEHTRRVAEIFEAIDEDRAKMVSGWFSTVQNEVISEGGERSG